jgi:hypothetical protein
MNKKLLGIAFSFLLIGGISVLVITRLNTTSRNSCEDGYAEVENLFRSARISSDTISNIAAVAARCQKQSIKVSTLLLTYKELDLYVLRNKIFQLLNPGKNFDETESEELLSKFNINLVQLYDSVNDELIHRRILEILDISSTKPKASDPALINFYKKIAEHEKPYLAISAIKALGDFGEISWLIELFKSRDENAVRKSILTALSVDTFDASKIDPNVASLFVLVANSKNPLLTPVALRNLLNMEGDIDSPKWQNWSWSNKLKRVLEESVTKDLYNLALLDTSELLALTKKFPNSLYAMGCKEYFLSSKVKNTYFSSSSGEEKSDYGVFVPPYSPETEIKFRGSYLKKFAGHPASDNAIYRLARSYEYIGDYENALTWYFEAHQSFDGKMSNVSGSRIIFLIDLVLSVEFLNKFSAAHPKHPLIPVIAYSIAVKHLREDNFELAEAELKAFVDKYRDSDFQNLTGGYDYNAANDVYVDTSFWLNVEQQIQQVSKLIAIHNLPLSDSRLYSEAVFYHRNIYLASNYIGGAGLSDFGFIPREWNGAETSFLYLIKPELILKANASMKQQIGWFRSIQSLNELISKYPESTLSDKALYTIALNYYKLANSPSTRSFILDQPSWKELALKYFDEFVKSFPNSSMADDALLSQADLLIYDGDSGGSINSEKVDDLNKASTILNYLLKNYPDGDRKLEANYYLKKMRE